MDTNHKTIDNKTRSEVSALFQGYVVQPLTEELQTKLERPHPMRTASLKL